MTTPPPELHAARERFMEMVADVRPDLHRYCSRLVGSAIDGEDVVQDALAKAYFAMSVSTELPPLRPWLMRIAHNTAIDFLRRYDRRFVEPIAHVDELVDDEEQLGPDVVREALSSFVGLPVLQRSCVILKDVLACSLEEIAQTTGTTVAAVKSSLARGRSALRAQPKRDVLAWRDRPETSARDRELLHRYVALFNARDWEGVQGLLAEECRLDLVSRAARRGKKQVGEYFGNYARLEVRLEVGRAEGRDVLGAFKPPSSTRAAYIVAIDCVDDRVAVIRDWHYVDYLMNELTFERESGGRDGKS